MIDERISRTINSLKSWDEIATFEANAKGLNRLNEEITAALTKQSSTLARVYVSEKTNLDFSKQSAAEEQIIHVVCEYVGIMRRQGKYPGRTLEQLKNRGLLGAVEVAVCRGTPTQGFQTLVDEDREELSYEQIVVDHPDEFTPRALWYSRRTLGLPNDTGTAPADTASDTQTRTAVLLLWLKSLAKENNGLLPPFTNDDSGIILEMFDLQQFGRVLGNIQSRIDYACYVTGLPPLGLAAETPFERAWGQDGRAWMFPIVSMQAAAQTRHWVNEDFDRILKATEALPRLAHKIWGDELSLNESKVKEWALSFGGAVSRNDSVTESESTSKRNPTWSRDELILALDLYRRHRESPPSKDSAEVAELSSFLNRMGGVLGRADTDTYRNVNGVYMKLMNFRRFDPNYIKDGKVGLSRGNKDEEVVWSEFAPDPGRLSSVVAAIRLAVDAYADNGELEGVDEPDIQEAEEGRVLTRLHRFRERSRRLVDARKKVAMKQHGRLFCEACGFDFSAAYGPTADGLIDVHHTKPVHTLTQGDTTKLEDLALLCANCHRVVHSSRKWLTVEQIKQLLRR